MSPASASCAEQVRRYDHDRYLTCLFAPAASREALFALYALNHEIAKTAEVVSEAMLGRVRLQWWREAVADVYAGQSAGHQAFEPLAPLAQAGRLSRVHFERLIDAREFDLDGEAPPTVAALEDYAEATSATLLHLALEILGVSDPAAEAAAREVGIAWALVGLLRAVPFHARRGRLYLPREITEQAGIEVRDLFALRTGATLQAAVEHLAGRADERLRQARARRREVPRAALPALLLATLAARELVVLRRAGFDPFRPEVQARGPDRVWRLAWARLCGRY